MTGLRLRRAAVIFLCLGGPLALGACAGTRGETDQVQQQSRVQAARQLCTDLGYKAGSTEFAQCAQSEYDRQASNAGTPSAPPQAGGQTAPAASSDDWFERWVHKPPVCNQRACSAW